MLVINDRLFFEYANGNARVPGIVKDAETMIFIDL